MQVNCAGSLCRITILKTGRWAGKNPTPSLPPSLSHSLTLTKWHYLILYFIDIIFIIFIFVFTIICPAASQLRSEVYYELIYDKIEYIMWWSGRYLLLLFWRFWIDGKYSRQQQHGYQWIVTLNKRRRSIKEEYRIFIIIISVSNF